MNDIASDVIGNIESYQQLLTTLSLGIVAGVFALLMQVIIHNASETNTSIEIKRSSLLIIGLVIQIISILCGVLTKSALVSSVSSLHQIQWGKGSVVEYINDAGLKSILIFAQLQVILFLVGIIVLCITLLFNWKLIRPNRL